MDNRTGFFSWLVWNLIVAFTFVDGALGLTQFSDISANMMWPVTLFIVFVSILYAGAMFLVVGVMDYADKDDENLKEVYYREPYCRKCDLVIDGLFCLFLAATGYFGISFVYFGGMVIQRVGVFFKEIFKEIYRERFINNE